jgi:hypothetical protein
VPELRRIGAEAAQGDVVAILEEHCTAPARWIETIRAAFQPGDVAVGGPIRDSQFWRVRE